MMGDSTSTYGEMRNVYKIFVSKPEGTISYGTSVFWGVTLCRCFFALEIRHYVPSTRRRIPSDTVQRPRIIESPATSLLGTCMILLKRISNELRGCEVALCSAGRVQCKNAVNVTLIVPTFRYGSETVEYLMRSSLVCDMCRWVINSRCFQER